MSSTLIKPQAATLRPAAFSAPVALHRSTAPCLARTPSRTGRRPARRLHVVATAAPTREELVRSPPSEDVEQPATTGRSVDSDFGKLSYSKQYDELYSRPLLTKKIVPKPSRSAQAQEPGAAQVLLSDVYKTPKRPMFFNRSWETTDLAYGAFILAMHGLALLAPMTFSWPMVYLFLGTYFVTGCLGITLSYHRQLAHKSFSTPKWLEYVFAYCGVCAAQGDPIEWASTHRYHHLHTDTPLDPHSTYEGFWWSHLGWVLDNKATLERVGDRSNTPEMNAQPFYTFLQKTYGLHVAAMLGALFALGGLPALVWGGALRIVWVYHITWFVNSASHVWGYQTYNTGDLSRNNWWVGILAWGEGWHNNHHAFEFSARHGLEWWQFDVTWIVIRALQAVGLATNVKLPSEKQKARLAFSAADGQ